MLGYLSESTFVWKLIYDIIMWIVILFIVYYCIKRNPTDYDTNYCKRNPSDSLVYISIFIIWIIKGVAIPVDKHQSNP